MKNLEVQRKLTKFLIGANLIIEAADHPDHTPTKQTKQIQDKARELQELIMPMVDRFYENNQVLKSTVFMTIENKVNYIINKEIK